MARDLLQQHGFAATVTEYRRAAVCADIPYPLGVLAEQSIDTRNRARAAIAC